MKRILSLIAVVTAAASSLMACGKKASSAEPTNTESAPKVLVAYFSATGTTKATSEKVAKATPVPNCLKSNPPRLTLPLTSTGRRRPPVAARRTTTRSLVLLSRRARSRSTATTSSSWVSPTGGTVPLASSTPSWTPIS